MLQVEFTEDRIGINLTGVDEYGYEVEDEDVPCLFVEVSHLTEGSPASEHPVLLDKALKSIAGQSVLGLSLVSTKPAIRTRSVGLWEHF